MIEISFRRSEQILNARTAIRSPAGQLFVILALLSASVDQTEARKPGIAQSIVKGIVGLVFDVAGNSVGGSSRSQAHHDEVICSSLIEAQKDLVLPYRMDDITVTRSMDVDCDGRFVRFVKMIELTRSQLHYEIGANAVAWIQQDVQPAIIRAQCEPVAGLERDAVGEWAFLHDYVDSNYEHLFRVTVALRDCPTLDPPLEFADTPVTVGDYLAFAAPSSPGPSNNTYYEASPGDVASSTGPAASPTVSTQHHLSAQEVRDVQAALKRLNYYVARVDGILGPKTMRAIQMYERDSGLPETGRISPALWSRLNNSIRHATGATPDQSGGAATPPTVRCVRKPVMRDADYLACGIEPPG